MKRSKKHFKSVFAVILTFALLCIAMSIPAFAASDYTYDSNNVITECNSPGSTLSNNTLTIPSQATGIASTAFDNGTRKTDLLGLFYKDAYADITTVVIPSSVKFIESGAFAGCKYLTSVTIQNYKSGINVSAGAFPNGIAPNYTKAEPTTVPPTTKPTTTTTKVTTAAPATTEQPTTQKPATTKKATTSKKTTTTAPATTTTTTTTTTQIEETSSPLEATKSNDLEVWNSIVKSNSKNADDESASTSKNTVQSSKSTRYLVDASVVVVAFSAGLLTYFKFRR